MKFKIQDIESETFYRFRRVGSRLKRVPGSAKKSVRVSVLCESRDGHVNLVVRQPTRAAAVVAVKDILWISDARWATMLRQYAERERRDAAREEARVLKLRRRQLRDLKRQVVAVRKLVKS